MRTITVFFTFFCLLSTSFSAFGQQDSISDWQEQVLSLIDADNFSEASYGRLMEMLGDLELNHSDSIFPIRLKQDLILSSNLCLNTREGFRNASAEKIQSNKAYRGDPWHHTVRYKMQYGKTWSAGFVLDKDPGEPFRRGFPSFDSFNGFIAYSPSAVQSRRFRIAKAIAGNYRVRLGSGLILNQAFSLGKNVQTETFMMSGTAISPHASSDEYNRMLGAVADLRFGRFSFIPFVSFRPLDAVVKDDTITSIPTDGYHRTLGEENKWHRASVANAGMHLSFSGLWYDIGGNIFYTCFSHTFYRPVRAYNIYYYRGKDLLQGSFDYHLRRFGFELRGETALDHDFNLASVNQVSHSLGEDWKAALSYRYFAPKYQSLYASSISEGSSAQGEQGATLAISGSPFPYWQLLLSADYFRFSNIQYGYDKPFSGVESRFLAQYTRQKWDVRLSYRLKSKQTMSHSLDATIACSIIDGLKLKTQLRAKATSEFGYAIAQAINWSREGSPLAADIQGCWFDSPDYSTRLYLSEKNVLYGFAIPMLYGRGIRASATGSYKFGKSVVIELKYSLFHYLDRDCISSGLQMITGANQSNLWLQVRLRSVTFHRRKP